MHLSKRILRTDSPIIVHMQSLMKKNSNAKSLAQGVVHWSPPELSMSTLMTEVNSGNAINKYCPDEGIAELCDIINTKLYNDNNIRNSAVMITAGANQGFVNVVLTLLDSDDTAVLFPPYYFNHAMALQMTGCNIQHGSTEQDTLFPSVPWLKSYLQSTKETVKMVVLCNPCNPTGILYPCELLEQFQQICLNHNVWLVVDNTYEYFVYDPAKKHCSVEGDNVINLFSFSKAYGMMGWRVGYLAYPPALRSHILKAQDTIPICPSVAGQYVALGAMREDPAWRRSMISTLPLNREIVLDALSPLLGAGGSVFGDSAIYLFVKLPVAIVEAFHCSTRKAAFDTLFTILDDNSTAETLDERLCDWLALRHNVLVVAGNACGSPNHFRVAFGNLQADQCREVAGYLRTGLKEFIESVETAVIN